MNRKSFISKTAVLAGVTMTGHLQALATPGQNNTPVTVAHITDVHIRSGDNAPAVFSLPTEKFSIS